MSEVLATATSQATAPSPDHRLPGKQELGRTAGRGISGLIVAMIMQAGSHATAAEDAMSATGISAGDTAWLLTASAMMLAIVSPGLALFYSGLVRSKNALATLMHSLVILCLVSVLWVLWGYSLAFGPDRGGVIGGLEWTWLANVGAAPHPLYAPTVPHLVFVLFQLMFAAITPALITGAFAERVRFGGLLTFAGLWFILIYCPIAHWIWGGGWLDRQGVLDFAGGLVVHLSAGMSALACAMVLGRRRGYGTDYMAPHNLPLTFLGAGLLWFGWFGFNGGSAFGANAIAGGAILATNTAAAAAALTWMAIEWAHRGKPTVLGLATGAVTGLATISAGAGYVSPISAMAMGVLGGLGCYLAIVWKTKIGYDDALDVVGIHAVAGVLGALTTGLLASTSINPAGGNGLFFGNPAQFQVQLVAVLTVMVFSFVGSYILLKLVDGIAGLRVSPEEEAIGLDLSQHNERAYS